MLLQSLRVFCKTPGELGSSWKFLEPLLGATGVSGRLASSIWTDAHFADVVLQILIIDMDCKNNYSWKVQLQVSCLPEMTETCSQ
jgi:hypothetical protein